MFKHPLSESEKEKEGDSQSDNKINGKLEANFVDQRNRK